MILDTCANNFKIKHTALRPSQQAFCHHMCLHFFPLGTCLGFQRTYVGFGTPTALVATFIELLFLAWGFRAFRDDGRSNKTNKNTRTKCS